MTEAILVPKEKKKPWYTKLIQDLNELLKKQELTTLQIKHEIGKRILKEKENITYGKIGDFMKELTTDLGYEDPRELYYCFKFAEKYPIFNDFIDEATRVLTPSVKSIEQLTWKQIRNIALSHGLEALRPYIIQQTKKQTVEKGLEEPKLCRLEKALTQLLMAINPLKDEMLDCKTCELRGWCVVMMAKLESIGTPKESNDLK